MKIKTDFVTNSSSTSFIVGLPGNYDTVETVYNMIRIIVNEMIFIINNVKSNIEECEEFENVKYVLTLSIFQSDLYRNYLENEFINGLFIKHYNDSLFSICCKDFEEDLIVELKTELVEPTLEYEYILSNTTYNQYRENSTNLELLNVLDIKEKDDLIMYLKVNGYDYFSEHGSVNSYNEFIKQIELIPDIKRFILNKIGSVIVNIRDDDFSSCFDTIVKHFFSR